MRMTNLEILAEQMKLLRERAGLTQDEAAIKADIHDRTVSKLEAGKTNPNLDTLEKLAKTYNVDLGKIFEPWLMTGDPPEANLLCSKVKAILSKDPIQGSSLKQVIDAVYERIR